MGFGLEIIFRKRGNGNGQGCHFIAWLHFLCILSLAFASKASPREDPVILLKQLMSNAVTVEAIAFEKQELRDKSPPESYFGRWDRGNFFLAAITNIDGLLDLESLSNQTTAAEGRIEDLFWRRDGAKHLFIWTNSGEALGPFEPAFPPIARNGKHYATTAINLSVKREMLLTVLHYGFGFLKPDSVVWDGLTFEAKNNFGGDFKGELLVQDGFPIEMRYKVQTNDPNIGPLTLHFDYKNGSSFPRRIELDYTRPDNKTVRYTEWRITEFQISPGPLEANLFDPQKTVRAQSASIEVSNMLYLQKGAHLVRPDLGRSGGSLSRKALRPWVVASLVLVICVPGFYLIKNVTRSETR